MPNVGRQELHRVRRSRITIVLLVLALVASNAWWAYRVLDAGITHTYMRASFDTTSETLTQALAILQVVAKPGATRSQVLAAAKLPNDPVGPFEKEGYVWVGQLGLQFNEQGQLVKAVTGTSGAGQ
jgi:hypothetical protein